jgi:hypothetical protein
MNFKHVFLIALIFSSSSWILVKDVKAQVQNEQPTVNGSYDQSNSLWTKKSSALYRTKDGLIIDDYQEEYDSQGKRKIKIQVYNLLPVTGVARIVDQQGKIVSYTSIASAPDRVGTNLVDGFLKWAEEGGEILTGQLGNSFDVLKYAPGDVRTGLKPQIKEFTLKPGERLELTNSDPTILASEKFIAYVDLFAEALSKTKKLSISEKDTLRSAFVKAATPEIIATFIKSSPNSSDGILKGITEKDFKRIYELVQSEINIGGIVNQSLSDVLSEGINFFSKGTPLAPVVEAADKIFGVIGFLKPGVKIDVVSALVRIKTPPLYSNYLNGSILNQKTDNRILDLMNTNILSITQCNSSAIGSASCYFRAANNPIQDVNDQNQQYNNQSRGQSIQQENTYTSGVIVRSPIDIGLTWNQTTAWKPSTDFDLDSHLVTPNGNHVYFPEASRGKLNDAPNAFLYRDSIPGSLRGAEQTRIDNFQPGQYQFFVNNFTCTPSCPDRVGGTTSLSNSGATVSVFEGGRPLVSNQSNSPANFNVDNPLVQNVGNPYPGQSTFNVPTNQEGNTWHVFTIDTRTGVLYRVNQFGNVNSASEVPSFKPSR